MMDDKHVTRDSPEQLNTGTPEHLIGRFGIRNIERQEWVALSDEEGRELPGIRGKTGVMAPTAEGRPLGIDLIEMAPGAAFPLHVHQGDHILYIVAGRGYVHVDGVDHRTEAGDTLFIPAEHPHGVRTDPEYPGRFAFLAVGYPHKHVQARDRMTRVEPPGEEFLGSS